MDMKTNYKTPIIILEKRRKDIITALKSQQTEALVSEKRMVEMAIKWLKKGEEFDIDPDKSIVKLPPTQTQTACVQYRIVEDFESDKNQSWKEIRIDEKVIRPLPGSLLILE